MRDKLRIFKRYGFFSLRVFLNSIFEFSQNFLSIKTIKYENKKIKFFINSEISAIRAELFGKKEKEIYDFISKNLDSSDILFDIGANVGVFSIYSSYIKNIKCVAFEPEYSNLYLLKKNIILNNLQNKIFVYPIALSNKNELSILNLSSIKSGTAIHTVSKKEIDYTDENAKVVLRTGTYACTLDDFINQTNILPTMLKIDTDGKEFEILQGGENALKKIKFIALEIPTNSDKEKEILNILRDNNFIEQKDLRWKRNAFFKKNYD